MFLSTSRIEAQPNPKSNGSNVKSSFLPSHIFRFVMSLSYLTVFQSIELCATSELRTQASQILSQKLGRLERKKS